MPGTAGVRIPLEVVEARVEFTPLGVGDFKRGAISDEAIPKLLNKMKPIGRRQLKGLLGERTIHEDILR